MNCYHHPSEAAVATCQDCQKGLCPECATAYDIPICSSCNQFRIKNEKSGIYKEFAWTLILGLLGLFISYKTMPSNTNFSSALPLYIFAFYSYAGIVAGWKTLNRLTPDIFLFLPLIGWLFYFLIKCMLSFMIGIFMLPIRLFKQIKRLRELNNIPIY